MHAEPETALIEPAAKVYVLIIASAVCRIKAPCFLKNLPADKKCVTLKAVGGNVTAGSPQVLVQIVPGIVVAGRYENCELGVSRQRCTKQRQEILVCRGIRIEYQYAGCIRAFDCLIHRGAETPI